jgi:membrane-bound lytic murein transglycosylase D
MINRNVHLQQIASVLNMPIQQLKDYNPQYKIDIIPGQWGSYPLRLPASYATRFIEMEDSIYNYKDASINMAQLRLGNPTNSKGSYATFTPSGNKQRITYVVRSGDNLGAIAARYRVSVNDLREWNNISRSMIRSGQRLIIYTSRSGKSATVNEEPKLTASVSTRAAENSIVAASSEEPENFIVYKVKSGDTLWDIANQYPGVSDRDLMKWNNISSSNKLFVGQKIKIKKTN